MTDAGRSRGVTWWLLTVYCALAIAAAAYALYKGNVSRAGSEFSGMPLSILALPWSWWFRDFNPALVRSAFNNSVIVTSGFALLNVAVLWAIGRVFDRKPGTAAPRGSVS